MDLKYKTPHEYTENTLVFRGRWDFEIKGGDIIISNKSESYEIPIEAIMKVEYEVWNVYRFYFIAYTASEGSFIVLKDIDEQVIAVIEICKFRNKSKEILKILDMVKSRNGDTEFFEPVKSAVINQDLGPIKKTQYRSMFNSILSILAQVLIIGAVVYLGFTVLLS